MFRPSSFHRPARFVAVILLAILAGSPQAALAAKNVIIMISDGAGHNTWLATSMYRGKLGKEVYDAPDWVRLSSSTYPLNRSNTPTKDDPQDPKLVYDPAKAWSTEPGSKGKGKLKTAGYQFLAGTATDSAASATVMATGVKTYNNSINFNNQGKPLTGATLAEIAKRSGRSVGQVTSVPWSHATPAGFSGAHNVSRNNYVEIANEMLNAPYLDVLMGCGHPEFTDDGAPRQPKTVDYQYIGGKATWDLLRSGKHPGGWELIEAKSDFEGLAAGFGSSAKICGVAQAASTLQQKRTKGLPAKPEARASASRKPYQEPPNRNVPALATMAAGSLNALSRNPRGFYLMIEGGAVDWSNHANLPHRMIEEQIDFLAAVETVVAWVQAHGGWKENLLIVTSDHECGMVWGPQADEKPFDPIADRGPGNVPGLKHLSSGHSNQLVPLFARGAGSEEFLKQVVGKDPAAAKAWSCSGDYIDNSSVFKVANEALQEAAQAAR